MASSSSAAAAAASSTTAPGSGLADEEVETLTRARSALTELRQVVPELLSRCQLVVRWRDLVRGGDSSARTLSRLATAEEERDALRAHVLGAVDACGDELQELRLLVTACVGVDDKLLGKPVGEAVKDFARSVGVRRAALLQRLKRAKKAARELRTEASAASLSTLGSDGAYPDAEELLFLRSHLQDLMATLEQVVKCDAMLARVRAESYVTRYEGERASALVEKAALVRVLERWAERNAAADGRVWAEHGELVGVILKAAGERVVEADLVAAMKEDVERFVANPEVFPQQPRKPISATSSASGSGKPAKQAQKPAKREPVPRQQQPFSATSASPRRRRQPPAGGGFGGMARRGGAVGSSAVAMSGLSICGAGWRQDGPRK